MRASSTCCVDGLESLRGDFSPCGDAAMRRLKPPRYGNTSIRPSEQRGDYRGHENARRQDECRTDQESSEMKPVILITCRAFRSWQNQPARADRYQKPIEQQQVHQVEDREHHEQVYERGEK